MATSTLEPARASSFRTPPRALVWGARLLALVAAGIAAYLLWVSLANGGEVAGCSDTPGADCSSVLKSEWSTWLGLPVSLPAVLVYLAMFAALFGIDAHSERTERDAWRVLVPLVTLAIGAGSWFSSLQIFDLNNLCFYCLGVHACGLLLAVFVFWFAPIRSAFRHSDAVAISPGLAVLLMVAGLAGVGVLIGGQALAAPRESQVQITEVPVALDEPVSRAKPTENRNSTPAQTNTAADPPVSDPTETNTVTPDEPSNSLLPGVLPANIPKHRRISLLGGKVSIDAYEVPILGDPEADAVLVELFDYTCPHCRELAPLVEQARERYGPQLAIVPLPMPMNKTCNRYVHVDQERHKEACHYARLALAVWLAKPDEFETLHRWLLDSATVPTVAAARDKAAEILGGQKALEQALTNKAIARQIEEDGRIYHLAGHGQIPKLLGDRMIVTGVPSSDEKLYEVLEQQFGIHP